MKDADQNTQGMTWFASWLAAPLTWIIVIALPIGIEIAIHRWVPRGFVAAPWLCGGVLFALLFLFAERLWRGVQFVLNGFKSERME